MCLKGAGLYYFSLEWSLKFQTAYQLLCRSSKKKKKKSISSTEMKTLTSVYYQCLCKTTLRYMRIKSRILLRHKKKLNVKNENVGSG